MVPKTDLGILGLAQSNMLHCLGDNQNSSNLGGGNMVMVTKCYLQGSMDMDMSFHTRIETEISLLGEI